MSSALESKRLTGAIGVDRGMHKAGSHTPYFSSPAAMWYTGSSG